MAYKIGRLPLKTRLQGERIIDDHSPQLIMKQLQKSDADSRPKMVDDKDIGPGAFSNVANVAATKREVILDFGMSVPVYGQGTDTKVVLVSRVTLTKDHAIELRDALTRTIERTPTL